MIPRRRRPIEDGPGPTTIQPADFDRFFNAFVATQQKTWKHDRTKTVGGSEIFGCLRKAWYGKHGTPKDADYKESWGATRRGDLIENYHVVPAMVLAAKSEGFNIDYVGEEQATLFTPDAPISITPDGLIHGIPRNWLSRYGIEDIRSDCVMFEIKSIDPRVDLSEEKAIHHGQVQGQMGIVRDTTPFTPHYAVILYVDASFFDDMSVFIVEFEPQKWEAAKKRAHRAMEETDPAKIIREGVIDGSCQYCPFKRACLDTTMKAMPPAGKKPSKGDVTSPALVSDIEGLMMEARKVRFEKKQIDKKDALVKEQIKEILRKHGTRRGKDANWSVSYFEVQGRESLDKGLLDEALLGIRRLVEQHNLTTEVDEVLKDIGVGVEGQNEPRLLTIESFMKRGDPYESMKLTYTEPEAEDV